MAALSAAACATVIWRSEEQQLFESLFRIFSKSEVFDDESSLCAKMADFLPEKSAIQVEEYYEYLVRQVCLLELAPKFNLVCPADSCFHGIYQLVADFHHRVGKTTTEDTARLAPAESSRVTSLSHLAAAAASESSSKGLRSSESSSCSSGDSSSSSSLRSSASSKPSDEKTIKKMKKKEWSTHEHRLFLMGLKVYKKGNWAAIAKVALSGKRTASEVERHAEKYFQYLQMQEEEARKNANALDDGREN